MGRARIQRIKLIGAMTMASLTAVTIGFSAYVTAAVYNKTKNLEPTGGEVALRSYFQKGSGTELDPFVISRPIHFYNLSRLQNLGVFSSKMFFVLGYDPDHPDDIHGKNGGDLTFYKDNSSSELVTNHTLDMSSIYSLTDSVVSIGDECAPFCGDFNGHGLAISGLKISSKPEDVGVLVTPPLAPSFTICISLIQPSPMMDMNQMLKLLLFLPILLYMTERSHGTAA